MAAAGRAANLSVRLHHPPPPLLPPLPLAAAAACCLSTPMPSAPRGRLFWRLGRKKPPPPPPLCRLIGPISSSLTERAQQQQQEEEISFTDPEAALVEALLGIQGRGRAASPQQLQALSPLYIPGIEITWPRFHDFRYYEVERAVQTLETLKGVPDPTSSSLIEGCWQLIFTTRPGTASPIQRTFVGVDFFKIFQEVYLRTDDPRVSNIVMFSDAIGELKVEAAATVEDGKRILFRFDRAAFSFKFLPFKVPYPVPFRLLGDEAKGWLDTTYLSHTGNIRISRGNKGTTFVLQKKTEPRQRLLSAISSGTGVEEVIDELIALNRKEIEGDHLGTLEGEWQLLWASQSEDESWSSIAANGLKGLQPDVSLQIIKEDGKLENVVVPILGLTVRASGTLIKGSDRNTYSVTMNEGSAQFGALKLPLNAEKKFDMEIVYIDNKIRVTRGDTGTLCHWVLLFRSNTGVEWKSAAAAKSGGCGGAARAPRSAALT
ncbi:putative plastid-lipid-associated protein 12, chloroplastic [Ananas comosus]|uniref:Putative plastid-lipid-associated protein 12, chloroplastic n=1 Tax=Ananas comosus TaxID=4615 RepID=A0A199W1G0_ANACO|nr:putative plastid-lipid-associated protein 12, chloroplastic [Ananas comosus]